MSENDQKKKSVSLCLITTRCVLQTESKELSAPSTPEMCGMGFKKPSCDYVSLPVFILCNIYETNGKREKQEAISVPNTSTGLAFLRGPSFNTHTYSIVMSVPVFTDQSVQHGQSKSAYSILIQILILMVENSKQITFLVVFSTPGVDQDNFHCNYC